MSKLRKDIIQDHFPLGAKISEAQLSEHYGVTKAPVRAAILRLAGEGLLEVKPQSGTYVFYPNADGVRALCELRAALEIEALRLAMGRDARALAKRFAELIEQMDAAVSCNDRIAYQALDKAYHDAIFEIADSPMLFETYQTQVVSRISALRYRFSDSAEHHPESISDHKDLLNAIKAGETDLALTILRKHISYSDHYYRNVIRVED